MRKSSAEQLDLGFETVEARSGDDRGAFSPRIASAAPGSSAPLKIPDFGADGEIYAATSRMAGRINAANISELEHKTLLRERQELLDKKFSGTITQKEKNRLEYVRWSLDRIEDAKQGQALDMLETAVGKYEKFLTDIRSFEDQLSKLLAQK